LFEVILYIVLNVIRLGFIAYSRTSYLFYISMFLAAP
jgi:hypothetical protein